VKSEKRCVLGPGKIGLQRGCVRSYLKARGMGNYGGGGGGVTCGADFLEPGGARTERRKEGASASDTPKRWGESHAKIRISY